jgi:hypothetical protein
MKINTPTIKKIGFMTLITEILSKTIIGYTNVKIFNIKLSDLVFA